MPHQQHVWDVALELLPDGTLRYNDIDLTIMRRSGKTTLEFAKSTWRMTMAPRILKPNGKPWGRQRALYTSQRRQDARKTLEQDFALLLRESGSSFRELRNPKSRPVRPTEWKLSLNNGAEHILFGTGNYFAIDAPTQDAGHGDALDDANLDEIWALQNDDVEHGLGPTMATRWNPQMWRFSTAGNATSFYLYGIVRAGRSMSCTCGTQFMHDCSCGFAQRQTLDDRTAYFEWSIPDDADIDDEEVWWEHMPALGRTIPVEFVRSRLEQARRRPEGEGSWRRAYGNQWVEIPLLGGETRLAKLPQQQWADSVIDEDDVPTLVPGDVTLGFDVAPGGECSTIVMAAGTQNSPYVEMTGRTAYDHKPATGWLPDRLVELAIAWKPSAIGFDQSGPAGALADSIRAAFSAAKLDIDIVKPLTSGDYKAACGAFFLDVKESRLHRLAGQTPLDAAGGDATDRRVGDAWVWDRRSAQVPITPLVAATVARSLLPTGDLTKPVFAA